MARKCTGKCMSKYNTRMTRIRQRGAARHAYCTGLTRVGRGRAPAGSWQVEDTGRGGEVRIGLSGREPGEVGRVWVCLPRAAAAPDVSGSAAAGQPGPTRAGDGVWRVPVVTVPSIISAELSFSAQCKDGSSASIKICWEINWPRRALISVLFPTPGSPKNPTR